MKKILLTIVIVIISQYSYAQKVNLDIKILGISQVKGLIQIGIYNESDAFPKIGMDYRVEYFTVVSKKMTVRIKDLPHGEYSIALFHDINSDGECNLNFIGIPNEPYGFSNNVKPVFEAPSFESTKVVLKTNKVIRIKLRD